MADINTSAKLIVEGLVTAILSEDPAAQAFIVKDLTEGEALFARAGAAIIAGMYVAIAASGGMTPLDAWQRTIGVVNRERGSN